MLRDGKGFYGTSPSVQFEIDRSSVKLENLDSPFVGTVFKKHWASKNS